MNLPKTQEYPIRSVAEIKARLNNECRHCTPNELRCRVCSFKYCKKLK